jgi:para-nitrobenzyl esterase
MEPRVTTNYGTLRGSCEDDLLVFRGIPYARPPTGSLRFAPPQPPDAWTGVRDAVTFGPSAIQAATAATGESIVAATSEDCLTLNVWTPATDDGRRPVLVWLHGGAYLFGGGAEPMFHGASMARRGDVVVVTLNYRLGLFGYLRGIDVCGEALPSTGNAGLLDQLAALTWVQQEIAAFGGDPTNVTVFGQSAGAGSISALLAMPLARGLFHQAILQSGSTQLLQTPAVANRVMESILADLDLAPHEAGQLRDLPAAQLLEVQERVTPRTGGVFYGPVADGQELPADPLAAIAAGSAQGIPMLIGTNLEERKFFRRIDPEAEHLTEEGLLSLLANRRTSAKAGDQAAFDPAEAVAVYQAARSARGELTTPEELWFAMLSDRRYRVPALRQAELHADHTPQTYAYLFSWKSPAEEGRLGAGHGVEIPFVFGTLDTPVAEERVPEGSPVGTLSVQIQDAWIAFARTGSPQTPRLPDWEPYTATDRCTMLFDLTSGSVDAPYEAERRFWATAASGTAGAGI